MNLWQNMAKVIQDLKLAFKMWNKPSVPRARSLRNRDITAAIHLFWKSFRCAFLQRRCKNDFRRSLNDSVGPRARSSEIVTFRSLFIYLFIFYFLFFWKNIYQTISLKLATMSQRFKFTSQRSGNDFLNDFKRFQTILKIYLVAPSSSLKNIKILFFINFIVFLSLRQC